MLAEPALAQRQWGLSDSTSYAVGGDTVLIASRKKLYRALPNDTMIIRDFTDVADTNLYIRDVDHWSANDWYVLVGSRYIGYSTTLYRTQDAGSTWFEDVSYLPVVDQSSLNQMTIKEDGIAYLFNGYYDSAVLRSFDGGVTWEPWFQSLIAHYYGLLRCGNTAFVIGMEGDGFPPSMWQVPDSLWGMQGLTNYYSGCHNGGIEGCYYVIPWSAPYAQVVAEFQALAVQLCATLGTDMAMYLDSSVRLSPNPASEFFTLEGLSVNDIITVTAATGQVMRVPRNDTMLDVRGLAPGVYLVNVLRGSVKMRVRFFCH
ncbi:MAG: T9SS type A sorting domain-containing protein [Flavobacteriales bacterium]|nr:T9SS type A sorting domain-containing protein [Flavobacteriales bacterium]